MPLVLGRAALVGDRRGLVFGGDRGSGSDRLGRRWTTEQRCLRARAADAGADGSEADPGVGDHAARVERERGAGGDDRPITSTAVDLLVGAACPGGGPGPDLDQDLVVGDAGL